MAANPARKRCVFSVAFEEPGGETVCIDAALRPPFGKRNPGRMRKGGLPLVLRWPAPSRKGKAREMVLESPWASETETTLGQETAWQRRWAFAPGQNRRPKERKRQQNNGRQNKFPHETFISVQSIVIVENYAI